jgi:predicted nucleotidyltransferase
LRKEGCKEIYLFGSLVHGDFPDKSDIDLAVKGLEKRHYFKILGKLMMALEHSVDLRYMEKGTGKK